MKNATWYIFIVSTVKMDILMWQQFTIDLCIIWIFWFKYEKLWFQKKLTLPRVPVYRVNVNQLECELALKSRKYLETYEDNINIITFVTASMSCRSSEYCMQFTRASILAGSTILWMSIVAIRWTKMEWGHSVPSLPCVRGFWSWFGGVCSLTYCNGNFRVTVVSEPFNVIL